MGSGEQPCLAQRLGGDRLRDRGELIEPAIWSDLQQRQGQAGNSVGAQDVICVVHAVAEDDEIGLGRNPSHGFVGGIRRRSLDFEKLEGIVSAQLHGEIGVGDALGPKAGLARSTDGCTRGVLDTAITITAVRVLKSPAYVPQAVGAASTNKSTSADHTGHCRRREEWNGRERFRTLSGGYDATRSGPWTAIAADQLYSRLRMKIPLLPRLQVRTFLVLWLFMLSAVAFLDRTNVSIAGPAIRNELRLDDVHLGWVFSAFLLGYAAFQVAGGWLAYRFGPRRVLAGGVLWWGLFSALTTAASPHLSNALLIMILIRFALGAGEAVIYPASNQFVAQWIPVAERGRANGWIFAGVGAGAGLSIPALTWIISHYGWRAAFWFSAVAGLLVGLVWYAMARDVPEEHPLVSSEELSLIQSTRSTEKARHTDTPLSWGAAIWNRNVVVLTLSYFTFGYVAWIFFSWFFIYMAQVRGLNLKASALVSMIPFIAMTICCLAGGLISDALSKKIGLRRGRCGIAALSLAATGVFLVVGSHVHGPYAASIILAGGAGALYLSQSSFWAVSADISGARSGVVSGVMNMGCQIGGAVTASLTPYIASRLGWNSAFVFAALLAVAGGGMWLLVDPSRPQRAQARSMAADSSPAASPLPAK